MNRHLIPVEIGVIGKTHQRVNLNRASLHQANFERLNSKSVQRRGTIQQNRTTLYHLFQDIPHFWSHAFCHALSTFDICCITFEYQAIHDKWLEEL